MYGKHTNLIVHETQPNQVLLKRPIIDTMRSIRYSISSTRIGDVAHMRVGMWISWYVRTMDIYIYIFADFVSVVGRCAFRFLGCIDEELSAADGPFVFFRRTKVAGFFLSSE